MVRKPETKSLSHTASKIVGGALIGGVLAWVLWTLLMPHPNISSPIQWILPYFPSGSALEERYPALKDAGITLTASEQKTTLNREQALSLARQLEADAADSASKVEALQGIMNYPASADSSSYPEIKDTQVWLIIYQKIPTLPTETSADPNPSSTKSEHDLYVFLDANTGNKILVIWA